MRRKALGKKQRFMHHTILEEEKKIGHYQREKKKQAKNSRQRLWDRGGG